MVIALKVWVVVIALEGTTVKGGERLDLDFVGFGKDLLRN